MDLHTASQRLAQPFAFGPDAHRAQLPIAAHGLIGDGCSCALVRPDGVIDWLCLPRFDSPSVFAALLDPVRGGMSCIRPDGLGFEALQQYEPDTNVLETLFRVPGRAVVRLTDYMPWQNDPRSAIGEIHRRIECLEGELPLVACFDPRFDYGRDLPVLERHAHGVLAVGAARERLACVLSRVGDWQDAPDGGLQARFSMRAGERRWMVLSWNAPRPEPIAAYRPFEQLRVTRMAWRDWSHRIEYAGPWRHHVVRSALCLKLLVYGPTGAMVAAPTTSLPEWLGGTRNWDYRFTWTRDTAMSIRAMNLLGYRSEARDFFHFVRDNMHSRDGLKVMYAIDGAPVPHEQHLPELSGHAGSGPVRIGNGARDQLQLDTVGALLDAAFVYERFGGSLTLRVWRRIRELVHLIGDSWRRADDGIWEPRGVRKHNVHSKVMSWLAFRRGAQLACLFADDDARQRWLDTATLIQREVGKRGLDSRQRHFVSAYGGADADAALLLLPIHHFVSADDPRTTRTVEWIRSELGDGPFLHRYRCDDGVGGAEGAFLLCGFWLAEVLAMAGRLDEAQQVFATHVGASNHLGLLAEEYDPTSKAQLGNFPQAFSHLGVINAAHRIHAELRLRDEDTRTEAMMELPE